MALREILKADTSKSNQIDLNDAAENKVNKLSNEDLDVTTNSAAETEAVVVGEKRSLEEDSAADGETDESVKKQKTEAE